MTIFLKKGKGVRRVIKSSLNTSKRQKQKLPETDKTKLVFDSLGKVTYPIIFNI